MSRLYRSFTVERTRVKDDRTFSMVFASEYPVPRRDPESGEEFDEILSCAEADVDLSRLKSGAPLLEMHDLNRQRGVIESAELDGDKCRATARFSKSEDAEKLYQDVKDGIRQHVSVGYDLTGIVSKAKGDNGRVQVRFKWMPFEISIVSAPEDPNTGIGRSLRSIGGGNAAEFQAKALAECIAALKAVIEGGRLLDRARSSCLVALTACEACATNFSAGTADVCWDECYEAAGALRGNEDPLCQAACVACCACAEMCWQILVSGNRSVDAKRLEKRNFMVRILRDPSSAAGGGGTTTTDPKPATAPDLTVVTNGAIEKERTRAKAINTAADTLSEKFPSEAGKFRAHAVKAINDGTSAEDFNANMFKELPGVKKVNQITMRSIGMNDQEIAQYSVARGIRSMLVNGGRLDGLEGEVHKAMCDQKIGVDPEGMWVPSDYALVRSRTRSRGQRDLNVSTFNQGGALVPTVLPTSIIEILRNRLVCERLGCQSLTGLAGNVAMPRQTGTATAYAVPESGALTKSTQALDQIPLTPHRVGAWNDYTRQLLLQTSVDVENFIRDDILKTLGQKWDYLILQGSGANDEPVGILNTPGIGSVHFGAAATWAKILAFETSLSVANADAGNIAFVTTPKVRAALKAAAKIGSTFPVFIWETFNWGDGSNDGAMNGYRAAVTNQILNDLIAFGNWEDCIGPAMWGGFDFIVNPYSRDTEGAVRVTCNTYGDVAVRHAQSFCWSDDNGNQ